MNKIGRSATIVSMGFRPKTMPEVKALVLSEVQTGCDLILLPETCIGNDTLVSLDGTEVAEMAEIAAKYKTYIVFPVFRNGGRTGRLNTAIMFDRAGKIVSTYDKVFPYWSEFDMTPPATPGDDAPVVETDFGKVGIAICFDANFPEVFKRLSILGAELVLWPSAYSAGMSLQAHAINYNYMIVTATMVPDCLVYDITGQEIYYQKGSEGGVNISRVTVDLDRCIFHENFNISGRDLMLKDHAGDLESDLWLPREQWFTLRATRPGVSARVMAAEHGLEELRDYKKRSQQGIDKIRGYRFVGKTL
jgi:predicted amidohydrolase